MWAIVDEAALHRSVGGRDAIHAQLKHLVEAADMLHVTLQVVPYDADAHPGMAGAFAILQFGEPSASDVVYIESRVGSLFLESEMDLASFGGILEHLRALSLPPDDSIALIQRIAPKATA
ncbi:MAG TPA: DUF5753 domain-containing protein [Streptosporangiaceae bacterium]|nr:DUF5753 domain-containing protein [Streptosporangiaceae bacterium]